MFGPSEEELEAKRKEAIIQRETASLIAHYEYQKTLEQLFLDVVLALGIGERRTPAEEIKLSSSFTASRDGKLMPAIVVNSRLNPTQIALLSEKFDVNLSSREYEIVVSPKTIPESREAELARHVKRALNR